MHQMLQPRVLENKPTQKDNADSGVYFVTPEGPGQSLLMYLAFKSKMLNTVPCWKKDFFAVSLPKTGGNKDWRKKQIQIAGHN